LSPAPDNSNSTLKALATPAPILCYVTDRNSLVSARGGTGAGLLHKIRAAIEARVDWIQIREKDLAARELFTLVHQAVSAVESQHDAGSVVDIRHRLACTKIIVNDRLDVAVAGSAAGVHLGSESTPVREVVQWCRNGNAPREFLIGVSCHNMAEACEAENAGAGYVIFGPVFDTPSKRRFGEPVGIAQLAQVCAGVKIPVLAIGGVDTQNARGCLRAGAAGIAAIRMFQDAGDADKLRSTIELLRGGPASSVTR
jgi:thiamine-phosphate pyrophosphorylase